jgi:hypothetical protein
MPDEWNSLTNRRNRSLFIDYPKELFELCFHAVKSYLAGEPFREFETSMFFHR